VTVTLEFDDAASAAVKEIVDRTKMDLSKILSYALSLVLWALRQSQEKRIVASVDESKHRYRELDLDAVLARPQEVQANARKKKRKVA